MSADLLLELAWKSALCAGVTLLLLSLIGRRSAAERSWLAHAGLFATLVLPLTVVTVPGWHVSTPGPVARITSTAEHAFGGPTATSDPSASQLGPVGLPGDPIAFGELLPWLYGVPATLLFLLLLAAVLRLQILRKRAEVLVEPSWATALAAAQRRLGFKHGTALLVSNELRSPISWGVIRPIILLDQRAASDCAQAEAIVAHELAHVARLDWAKLLSGRLVTAIFWFNPLVWILARQCHELCEEAVDDTVLQTDIRSTDYAALLISAARHDNRAILTAANGVAGCGSLTCRVERVLDPSRRRVAPQAAWLAACSVWALMVAGPLSALSSEKEAQALSLPPAQVATSGPAMAVAQKTRPILANAASKALPTSNARVAASTGKRLEHAAGRESHFASSILAAAMIEAVSRGDQPTVQQLMRTGMDPNVTVQGDGTPLIAAARAGRTDLAGYLIRRGARPNLGVAGDGNPLIVAAAAGHEDVVRLLLDNGAAVDASVPGDENALIQASSRGHLDVVRLLISRGADVNARYGVRTPLIVAKQRGHDAIVQLLVAAGARP